MLIKGNLQNVYDDLYYLNIVRLIIHLTIFYCYFTWFYYK